MPPASNSARSSTPSSRKFGKFVTGTLKYADFNRDRAAFPDVRKIWVQVEFSY